MPLYDYCCEACGHHCELLEKMNAKASTNCPACHKSELKRQVSAPQFQLKGKGWYVTDFKPGTKEAAKEVPAPKTDSKDV